MAGLNARPTDLRFESWLLAYLSGSVIIVAGLVWHKQLGGILLIAVAVAVGIRLAGALGDLVNAGARRRRPKR